MDAQPEATAAAAPDQQPEAVEQQQVDAAGPQTDAAEQGTDAAEQQPMSKRQMKRLAKQEMLQKKKAERKAAHKAAQAAKKAEAVARIAELSPEELQAKRDARRERTEAQRGERAARRGRLAAALSDPAAQRIIVDCEFEDKMHEGEVKSLCKQLAYSYSANAQAETPVHLVFTSLQGRMADAFTQVCNGAESWVMTKAPQSYLELPAGVLPGEGGTGSLVYLTADSEHELSELEPSKAYIVGGIVDRNRHKGICLKKAEEQGIATARLPIGQYMQLASSKVLATNHVVEIMLKWMALRDWQARLGAAFEAVIPTRKRKHEEGEQKEAAGGAAAGDDEAAQGAAAGAEAGAEGEPDGAAAAVNGDGAAAETGEADGAAAKRQRSGQEAAAAADVAGDAGVPGP